MVASLVRYHNAKSEPEIDHPSYAALEGPQRHDVRLLSSLLRIAEKLESEHAQRVAGVDVQIAGRRAIFVIRASDGTRLDFAGLERKAGLFEKEFHLRAEFRRAQKKGKGSLNDSLFVRHGIAVDRTDPKSPPEAERPLTAKGVQKTRSAALGFAEAGREAGCFYHQPLHARGADRGDFRRGAGIFNRENPRERCTEAGRQSGGDCEGNFAAARERSDVLRPCAASGRDHRAIGGSKRSDHGTEKSGRRCFEHLQPRGRWELRWVLTAKLLRKLAD